ncbi:MAG: excinuclease ABC subunit A, partial [Planctomycetota bacterium]
MPKKNSLKKSAPISIRGCRVHNLRDIDLDLERGQLIVFCGLSGSGKTSVAIDTLHAEGQRAYVESFSAYTRQYLARIDKPDCESIDGIPPSVAVTRASGVRTNRSTVATQTELAEYLRLAFSAAAKLICYSCGEPVAMDDPASVASELASDTNRARFLVGFAEHLPNKLEAAEILLGLQQEGYVRLIVGGQMISLSDDDRPRLAKQVKRGGTDILVVVDRLTSDADESRITESLETAMSEGGGRGEVWIQDDELNEGDAACRIVDGRSFRRRVLSTERRCDACDIDFPDPIPRLFNFNQPLGACPTCEGFGDVV